MGTDGNIMAGGYWQEQDIGVNIYYRSSTEERLLRGQGGPKGSDGHNVFFDCF